MSKEENEINLEEQILNDDIENISKNNLEENINISLSNDSSKCK